MIFKRAFNSLNDDKKEIIIDGVLNKKISDLNEYIYATFLLSREIYYENEENGKTVFISLIENVKEYNKNEKAKRK